MNKLIVAAEIAAFLLIAVICTAGCIGFSDDITGTYRVAGDNTSATFVVFEEGDRGFFIELNEKEEPIPATNILFTWTAVEPKKTYILLFTDGTEKTASLDKPRGLLIIDEVTYTETTSPFSGKYPPGDVGGQYEPHIVHTTPGPHWSA